MDITTVHRNPICDDILTGTSGSITTKRNLTVESIMGQINKKITESFRLFHQLRLLPVQVHDFFEYYLSGIEFFI